MRSDVSQMLPVTSTYMCNYSENLPKCRDLPYFASATIMTADGFFQCCSRAFVAIKCASAKIRAQQCKG